MQTRVERIFDEEPCRRASEDHPAAMGIGDGHMDSPMERRAAAERAKMGEANASGALFKGSAGRVDSRSNEVVFAKDSDGDGRISLAEKYDPSTIYIPILRELRAHP